MLGSSCPQLRTKKGGWNPKHGSWHYRLELPALPSGRATLRRGGFADQQQALWQMNDRSCPDRRSRTHG